MQRAVVEGRAALAQRPEAALHILLKAACELSEPRDANGARAARGLRCFVNGGEVALQPRRVPRPRVTAAEFVAAAAAAARSFF